MLPGLVGHASGALFKSVFAFDLDDLQQLDGDGNGEITGRIYSAGTGAAHLPKVMKQLGDAAAEIFARRGSSQPVAETLRRLEAVESQLREAGNQAREYGEAVFERDELARRIDEQQARLAELTPRRRELNGQSQAWDDWQKLRGAEAKLKELPNHGVFPDNPIVRLDQFEEQRAARKEEVGSAEAAFEAARKETAEPIAGEALLGETARIEALRRGRGSFDGSVGDLPKRQTELKEMESLLKGSLGSLGAGWDEARLERFDLSIPLRDQVERSRKGLAERRQTVRDRQAALESEQKEYRDAGEVEQEARAAIEAAPQPALDGDQLKERRAALREARGREGEYQRARQRREDLEGQQAVTTESVAGARSRRIWFLPGALLLGGAILAAGGFAMGDQPFAVFSGVALIAVGLLAGVYLLPSRGRTTPSGASGARDRSGPAQEAERTAREALLAALAPLAIDVSDGAIPDAPALDRADAALDTAVSSLDVWTKLSDGVAAAAKETARRQRRVEEAEIAREGAEAKAGELQDGWATWLREHDLADSLAPETVVELLSRVETARAEAKGVSEMRDRIAAIEKDIDEYRTQIAPLATAHLPDADLTAVGAVARVADTLMERFEEARGAKAERDAAEKSVEERERSLSTARGRLGAIEEKIAALLKEGGTGDAEEFRRRASQHLEREKLEGDRRDAESRIDQHRAPNQEVKQFREALAATTLGEIEEKLEGVEAEIDELTAGRDELMTERGSVEERLTQLSGDEEASNLRAEREMKVEQLRVYAAEWSKMVVARSLLNRARRRYEEQRQPAVIKRAQSFFSSLTGDRYTRLYAPMGEQKISVFEGLDRQKSEAQLSRGTREQLYLALRFGLVQEFGEQEEPLPVIVDEVLVNFDPERAERAARAFVELSKTNQVLVFSCHPWLVELFRFVAPDAGVVDLDALVAALS